MSFEPITLERLLRVPTIYQNPKHQAKYAENRARPYPKPPGFDGLLVPWGKKNWVNPPFGSFIGSDGKKKGMTAWMRKAIAERDKGNLSVIVFPLDKWVLLAIKEIFGVDADIRNLGDQRWLAIEDGSKGKGLGRHIACFILRPRCSDKDTAS